MSGEQNACELLSAIVKVPAPCRKIKNMELYVALSADYWSGTYDRVAGTLQGPAGKATFSFADGPSRGTHKSMAVKAKEVFGSEEIDIHGVDKITITARGLFSLTGNANDQFQIQGKANPKNYTSIN
jgi:hypothetical protein